MRSPSPPRAFVQEASLPSACKTDVVKSRTPVELVRSHDLSENVPYAYAAITPEVGRLVFTAGACPLDSAGNIVAIGDVAGQAERVMVNLTIALRAAGAELSDVLTTTVYVATPQPRRPRYRVGRRATTLRRSRRAEHVAWRHRSRLPRPARRSRGGSCASVIATGGSGPTVIGLGVGLSPHRRTPPERSQAANRPKPTRRPRVPRALSGSRKRPDGAAPESNRPSVGFPHRTCVEALARIERKPPGEAVSSRPGGVPCHMSRYSGITSSSPMMAGARSRISVVHSKTLRHFFRGRASPPRGGRYP